jgi:hypothetical protein
MRLWVDVNVTHPPVINTAPRRPALTGPAPAPTYEAPVPL